MVCTMGSLVVYTRHGYDEQLAAERESISRWARLTYDLERIHSGDVVLPRFALLPFIDALASEVARRGAKLIETPAQHELIADAHQWAPLLGDLTPTCWRSIGEVSEYAGPFFVKGAFNSAKDRFATHCLARNKSELATVCERLSADPLISQQEICIRPYLDLASYPITSAGGAPICEEYRFFIWRGQVLASGFYWADHLEALRSMGIVPEATRVPRPWLEEVCQRLAGHLDFYVLDVAALVDGGWRVIEINDACMSGLAGCSADELYANLAGCPLLDS